jgi:hypothetical protein
MVLRPLQSNAKDSHYHPTYYDHGDIEIEDAILFILAKVYPLHVHMNCTESAHGESPASQTMKIDHPSSHRPTNPKASI